LTRDDGTEGKQGEAGFASRWSRLKQDAKAGPEDAETQGVAEPDAGGGDAPAEDNRTDEEVLAELELPDPDTLKSGDNFAAFMAKGVPARLRNRALRKLWISDPVLANLDELIDYGEDFTDAANVIENLQTSYQVGKGFADKVAELSKEDGASEEELSGESGEEQVAEQVEADDETAADDAVPADLTKSDTPDETAIEPAVPAPGMPVRQRMRFRVAED
jgi:hypothetical protein